ncbi:AMP-binding protein [Kitasatospora sp. NPDC088134]|uniref:AMP-binding protein n=1 Tax=Kitasatospora sp. NPDC088134 TaxID=3364071 RepID=UPI0037F67865
MTRHQLLTEARASAAALRALGLRPGERVALAAGDPRPFVRTFLGALWAGLVPVPVPGPPILGRRGGWAEQLATVREAARPAGWWSTAPSRS